jgi:SAM-dependent methyltransferase
MRPDVEEVRNFYHTHLGAVARRLLVHRVRALWPDVRGQTILGLGYATPFMRPFLSEAERIIAAMPDDQGAVSWPPEGPSRSILARETELPLRDASVNRVLAVHSLEMAGSPRPLLREIWRVLAPEGKLLLLVPNRRGLWARFDNTPFGHGRPYSRGQLERLLASAMFSPAGWSPTLFMPPLGWPIALKTAVGLERAGSYAWPRFCGVLIVEAKKNLYAPILAPVKEPAPRLRTASASVFSASIEDSGAGDRSCAGLDGSTGQAAVRGGWGEPNGAARFQPRFVSRNTACSPIRFCHENGMRLPMLCP